MSTWTSSAVLAAALALAGCGANRSVPDDVAPVFGAVTQTLVTADDILVAGPAGFCVDPETTRDDGRTAFVLLAGCAAIAGDPTLASPVFPAVLTASIAEAEPGGALADAFPGLGDYFQSEAGRRLLSRDGDPGTVTILDSFQDPDAFVLHARDESRAAVPGIAPVYWRAYLDLGPRIATLSVLSRADQPIPDEAGLALLREFVAIMAGQGPSVPQR